MNALGRLFFYSAMLPYACVVEFWRGYLPAPDEESGAVEGAQVIYLSEVRR